MLSTMKIGTKVLGGVGIAVLSAALVGGIGLWSNRLVGDKLRVLADEKLVTASVLAALQEAQAQVLREVNALLLRRADASLRKEARDQARHFLQEIDDAWKRYDAVPHGARSTALREALKGPWDAWRRAVDGVVALVDERDQLPAEDPRRADLDARAWSAYLELGKADAPVEDGLDALSESNLQSVAQAKQAGGEAAAAGARTTAAAVLVTAVALLLLGLGLSRTIGAALKALVAEAATIEAAVQEGRLAVRGNLAVVTAEFQPIIAGMNKTIEAFVHPIEVTSSYVSRMARGDLPPRITERYQGDFDAIKQNLNSCIDTLQGLDGDVGQLAQAAQEGRLDFRADAARHQGCFGRLVAGMNTAVATLVGHLDSIPAPAFIVDRELRVRFLNTAALKVAGRDAAQATGQRCADLFKAGDCNTERCACGRAIREGKVSASETTVRPPGQGELEVAYTGTPIRDARGQVVGALEVIYDQTEVRRAMRQSQKVAAYQAHETEKIVAALERLSQGQLAVDVAVEAGDADTAAARDAFVSIAGAIGRSAGAVRALTQDVAVLADAAVAGKLSNRADAARHRGDYRQVVDGVNRTLDAVMAPINEAARVLEDLARRDLRARVTGQYLGDHARIKESVNATGTALHDALAQVAQAVDQVSSASTQIAASSQAVASGASEQASSLQETSASIESVTAMTRQTTASAQQANELAKAARTAAADGSAAVEEMQGAMGRIRASAEGTSQIIKDINEIAFQTNLLALNAAVEAARAGEAGRGFAVVAEEVRSLALRAKEAATKTEELIRQSVKEAVQGEVTAKQVAGNLGEIAGGVSKVSDIISEIASSAQAQSTGIEHVTRAVGEMDKVTQQNAASAEESSSAASELSGQAEELAAMVAAFQLESQGRASAGVPSRRAVSLPARSSGPAVHASVAPSPATAGNGRRNGAPVRDPFPMEDAGDGLKDF
jgi:methyl-accepting chemotaxis protein